MNKYHTRNVFYCPRNVSYHRRLPANERSTSVIYWYHHDSELAIAGEE